MALPNHTSAIQVRGLGFHNVVTDLRCKAGRGLSVLLLCYDVRWQGHRAWLGIDIGATVNLSSPIGGQDNRGGSCTMGAPKARQVRRSETAGSGFAVFEYETWQDIYTLESLPNAEVRRCAMLVFPAVPGNRWMSVSKDETLAAIRSGVLPASIGALADPGPDNSLALANAQDEIARLRDVLTAAQAVSAAPSVVWSVESPPPAVHRRHHSFEQVYKLAALGLNVYLVGPAGTGKTTLAEQVAEALSLPFGTLSCHAQMTGTALFGYLDAQGRYVSTDYRRMATGDGSDRGPGLFLMDEIDNGNANITAALNTGLANGHVSFPDGLRPIAATHVFMASANTYGTGATVKYIGRNALDAATLDRFVQVMIDYDEDLEREIAGQYGSSGLAWCERIHEYRKWAKEHSIDHVLSTRAIKDGAMMLAAGFTLEQVLSMRVFRGLGPDQVAKIRMADRDLKAPKAPAEVPKAVVETAEEVDPGEPTSDQTPAEGTGYIRIHARFESTCAECGEPIHEGGIAYWRKRAPGRKASVLHSHCHTVVVQREAR